MHASWRWTRVKVHDKCLPSSSHGYDQRGFLRLADQVIMIAVDRTACHAKYVTQKRCQPVHMLTWLALPHVEGQSRASSLQTMHATSSADRGNAGDGSSLLIQGAEHLVRRCLVANSCM